MTPSKTNTRAEIDAVIEKLREIVYPLHWTTEECWAYEVSRQLYLLSVLLAEVGQQKVSLMSM